MSRDDHEKDRFTDPETERRWGLGMAAVFVIAVIAVPICRLLGWS